MISIERLREMLEYDGEMTKEQVYDEQIAPLMDTIIQVCKEHKINMLADFDLDDGLKCTTALIPKDAPDEMKEAFDLLRPRSHGIAITVTNGATT